VFDWLFGKKASEPARAPAGQTLSDIVRGIAHAAESANDIGDMAVLNQLKFFFDIGDDGTFVAKTARVKLNGDHYIDVPLVSLVDTGGMSLNEMEVRMSVRLTQAEVKEQLHAAAEDMKVQRSSFGVALTGAKSGTAGDVIDVVMKFKHAAPQEGMARVLDEVAGQAQVKKFGPDTPPVRPLAMTTQLRKAREEKAATVRVEPPDELRPTDEVK